MLPARRRAVYAAYRLFHTSRPRRAALPQLDGDRQQPSRTSDPSTSNTEASTSSAKSELTGAARLLLDAIEEEGLGKLSSSRDHLVHSQGPIWIGEESQTDAVLRMLLDSHKPLRTGEGVKNSASEDKIRRWIKELDLRPRDAAFVTSSPTMGEALTAESSTAAASPHRTTIPPDQHRPWHSTYTGHTVQVEAPKVKYGTFIRKKADAESLANILELQLPAGADAKTRARVRESRKRHQLIGRVERAKEKALDYQLDVEGEEAETFDGNRQAKGSSVLGAGRGSASGLRAWAGLVEDRIQRAKGMSAGQALHLRPDAHDEQMRATSR